MRGFHEGELAVQGRAGVREEAVRLAGMLAPPDLRGGAARFLAERTFAALTARDHDGRLWISPLTGPRGFLDAEHTTLRVHSSPAAGDPLHQLAAGQPAGLIAVDFATRRRMRINGILTTAGPSSLELDVDQAYGNCPQYIQQRHLEPASATPLAGADATCFTPALSSEHTTFIRGADTFFLGTAHPDRGNDASHRGGPAGFVRVEGNAVWWPDYPGNNMFNSLGNLAIDDTAALLFVDFITGRTVHLSGTAAVGWTTPGSAGDDGNTGRRVRFAVRDVVDGPLLPLRATDLVPYQHNPPVTGPP
jgi:hypothetical protein